MCIAGPRVNVTRDLFAQDCSLFNRCLDSVVRCPVHGIDARTIAVSSCWAFEQERLIRDHGASDSSAANMIRAAVPVLKAKLANRSLFMKHPIKLVESSSLINTDPFWSSFTGLNTKKGRLQVIKRCCKENFVKKNDGSNQASKFYLPLTKAVLDVMNTVKA